MRFISRRNIPSIIYSDNHTTFRSFQPRLTTLFKLDWKFNIEGSPKKGGVWERLVCFVKNPLKITLNNQLFSFDHISTLVCKIESIINSRPFTYMMESINEPTAISQIDLLTSHTINADDIIDRSNNSLKLLLKKDIVLSNFFKQWKDDYFKFNINTGKSNFVKRLKIGYVILIDTGEKKQYWQLGKIENLFYNSDKICRSASIKCKYKIIKRTIEKIYPLESIL